MFKGIDLSALIPVLLTLITTVITFVGTKMAKANDAAAQKGRMEAAFIRLGAIAFTMVGDLWAELSSEFQTRFADGTIDASDRAAFRAIVERRLATYASKDELEKLAVAAGLPLPGVIAWVAEWAIDRLTKAHDVDIKDSASPAAYPLDYSGRTEIEERLSQGG